MGKNDVPILIVDNGKNKQQVQRLLANAIHPIIRKSCVYTNVNDTLIND